MRIYFILEDMPDGGVDIKSIRTELGDDCDTPANRLAQALDQKLHAYTAKEKQIRGASCLH